MEQSSVKRVLEAAKHGDKKTLQEVLAQKEIGVADEEGNTALMFAAANGQEEILRLLLDKESLSVNSLHQESKGLKYINLQNHYGWTALMQAASYGHLGSVVLLIQQGADLQVVNSWKASALVLASQGGHFGVVHTLINHGTKVDHGVSNEDISCTLTPLMAASQCGHIDVVRELLRGGAKVDVKLKAAGWTALMLAALNNQVAAVDALLKHGASKEACDVTGRTPVDLASALGHQKVAVLLAGGTIKNISDTEFFEAVTKGHVQKVKELLNEKPGLASIVDKDGATPLMFASNRGHKEMCEVLLEAKAEVNTKDGKYGWTALMHATHHKKYEVVELLGQHGADVKIRDNSGSTAYDIASMIGDIKMIKLIPDITVARLQKKTTPTSVAQDSATPSAVTKNAKVSTVTPTAEPKDPPRRRPPQHINLGELKSRLQNAYHISTPKVAILDSDDVGSRFPSRVRSADISPSSSTSSGGADARSPMMPSFLTKPRPTVNSPNSPNSPQNSSVFSKSPSPQNSVRLFPGPQGSGKSPGLKFPPPNFGARGSTGERKNMFPSQIKPGPRTPTHQLKGKPPQLGSTGFPQQLNERAITPRTRAYTEPSSPAPTTAWPGRKFVPSYDLKTVLEQESMAHHFSVFQEQEVDYDSFVSLCSEDLAEMGITDDRDRKQLMSLISRLNAKTTTTQDVFTS